MITIVYSDEKQIEKVKELNNDSLTFNFIDITTRKGKKEGWKVKNHLAARLDPFVVVYKDSKPIKAFYTEAGDAIEELIKYLKNEYKEM